MKKRYDLTQGGILNRLLLVALPIMGTQFLSMAYNMTDMFWLGQVGSDAVAASGSAGMYLWLSMAPLLIGRMGAEIGVSQSLGRGDEGAARNFAQGSLTLSVALGLLYGLALILFHRPLFSFFGFQEAEVAAEGASYLMIVGIGIPFSFVSATVAGIFTGSGNSRTPFAVNAVGLALNMALDPLMIQGFGWGVRGAAIATIIAQAAVCGLFLLQVLRGKSRPFAKFALFLRQKKEVYGQIFRWSTPIAVESMLFTLLSMLVARLVASFGSDAMAVNRVGTQIESLSWLIGGGFGSALTAFIGQNFGAGKWSRIHRGFRIALFAMVGWGVVITVMLFFGGGLFTSAFLQESHLIGMGADYLRILALCQIPACLEAVASGIFRGTGKTAPPSIVSIACNALRVPLAYWLASTALGLDGIWWAMMLGSAGRGIWGLLWYLVHRRKQPKHDVLAEGEMA